MSTKYGHIHVPLAGLVGGNSVAIIIKVTRAMRHAGVGRSSIQQFEREAVASAGQDGLLAKVCEWVNTDLEESE